MDAEHCLDSQFGPFERSSCPVCRHRSWDFGGGQNGSARTSVLVGPGVFWTRHGRVAGTRPAARSLSLLQAKRSEMRCRLRIQILKPLQADNSGGADVYTYQLVHKLAIRGHHVTLIAHHAAADVFGIARVYTISRSTKARIPLIWRLSPLLCLTDYRRFIEKLDLDEPDLVIGSAQQMVWAYRRMLSRIPFVYLPHSLIASREIATYPGSPIQRNIACTVFDAIERWALNHADRTLRFTHSGCEALLRHFGPRVAPRFEVIPAPVNLPSMP